MYLIVGAGFLGAYLIKNLSKLEREPVLATVRNPLNTAPFPNTEYVVCDITMDAQIRLLAKRCGNEPLTVFFFAACHNVDYLYEHSAEARVINIDALRRFLDTMTGIKQFFFCVNGLRLW